MKQRSRLDLLMMAIHRWLELPRVSRSIIAAEIVSAIEQLELAPVLANEGITFNYSDDPYNDARVNAQKIFRWLGQYEGTHAFPDRLFHLEQPILAAMPQALRIEYLNNVYAMVAVTVVAATGFSDCEINTAALAVSITKENAEAQMAVINLGRSPSRDDVVTAHRELSESRGTTQAVINSLEKHFPFLADKVSKVRQLNESVK